MKVQLLFKTPDVTDQIDDEDCTEEVLAVLAKFIRYGEYITVEFDTETNSCVAVPL